MFNPIWYRYSLIRIVLLLTCLLLTAACQPLIPTVAPIASPTRVILSNNLNWPEAWRMHISASHGQIPMAAVEQGKLILPQGNERDINLTGLDIQTGQRIWQQKEISAYGGVDSLIADNERVYLSMPFEVRAFRAFDGKSLWTTEGLRAHTGYTLLPPTNDHEMQVVSGYFRDGVVIYNINVTDGTIQATTVYTLMPKLQTDLATYYADNMFNLLAVDNRTRETLWQTRVGPLGGLQLVDAKELIVLSGPFLKSLSGLDPRTGKELWHTSEQNIASNFVVIGNTIYAISKDAALVAYDAFTGREVGRIVFSGGSLDIDHAAQYWLIASDSKVSIYFGDSQELIAFDLPPFDGAEVKP